MSITEDYHIYFDTPPVVFKARVNMPTTIYPVTHITFDGVTVGAFGDLIPDMTLTLGTFEGGDNLGRVRVQNVATATEIAVGRISQGIEDGTLDIQDNAYISVYDDYRVWAKIPRMTLDDDPDTPDVDTFKDSDIAVFSYNDEIPPKANAGGFYAGYIDPITGLITVQFPKGGVDVSYAVAQGATITDHLWDVVDGTIIVGSSTSAVITATFPAGRRWVGLTVTDSNGKVQTSRTFVLAVDPDDDVTYQDIGELSFSLTPSGTKVDMVLNAPLPRTTYMDGCLVLIWQEESTDPGSRSHMRFCGWLQTEEWTIGSGKKGLTKNTTVHAVDVAGRLMELPGFPQALERGEGYVNDEDELVKDWSYMPDLTMNRALNYLGAWHTTAWSLADVILPETGDDYTAMRLDTNGGNIFEQLSSTSKKMVPAHILTCTSAGELIFILDWFEIDVEDRPGVTQEITEDDIEKVSATFNRQPKVHVLNTGAIKASTDWVLDEGEQTLPLVFSRSPGEAFSQGSSDLLESEGLAIDQEGLNKATGHRYARHNARYAPFQIDLANLNSVWSFIPAYMERVQVDIPADYASQRGLEFTIGYGLIQSLNVRVTADKKGNKLSASLNWEYETLGNVGVTHIPEESEDPDDITPDPATPDEPIGIPGSEDMIAGIGLDGFIYRTTDFTSATPTWDRVDTGIADTIYTWVVDPFSPGYLTGSGFINGWIVNDTGIYRVEDLFDTVDVSLVHTFETATSGASFHWRSVQASFGTFYAEGLNPFLICVSYYGDTSGHEGTWATHSEDGGLTWSEEVQISAHYRTGQVRLNPIGVYASPKTYGIVETTAYTTTGSDAVASGYISEDAGASWVLDDTVDSANARAGTIHVPWHDNPSESLVYHGQLTAVAIEGTPEDLMPFFGKLYSNDVSSNNYTALGSSFFATIVNTATETSGTPSDQENVNTYLIIAPPPDTKRMQVDVVWIASNSKEGNLSSQSSGISVSDASGTTRTGNQNYTPPPDDGVNSGSFSLEWSYALSGDWPVNNETIQATPPTSPTGCRVRATCVVNAVGSGNTMETAITMTAIVREIELDDGTIYTPVIESNARNFNLIRVVNGIAANISPTDETRSYGVNRGHFGVRAYDSDRQHLLASVVGNDVTGDAADDMHAVYYSDTEGVSWVEVVAPIDDSLAPGNRAAFEAAFSGDDPSVFFIWGPAEYMGYSDNSGASVDDKSGNLTALGHTGFIGIAGGPSGT